VLDVLGAWLEQEMIPVDCCDESDALLQIDIFIIPRPSYQSAIIIIMMMMMMPPGAREDS